MKEVEALDFGPEKDRLLGKTKLTEEKCEQTLQLLDQVRDQLRYRDRPGDELALILMVELTGIIGQEYPETLGVRCRTARGFRLLLPEEP